MNKLFLVAAVASAALCSTAAFAQDNVWAGPYVGLNLGLVTQPGDNDERINFDRNLDGQFNDQVTTVGGANAFSPGFCGGGAAGTANTRCTEDKDGADAGIRAGYDWQFGQFVVGVVGEASSVDATDSVSAFSTTPASYTFTRDAKWMGAVRGRVGYAAGPYLIYGTGGVAKAEVDHTFTTSNTMNSFTPRNSDSLDGYQYGVGVERQLNEGDLSLGLEYLMTALDDEDYAVRVGRGSALATNPFVLAPNTTGTDLQRSHSKFAFGSIRLTATARFK